MTTRGIPEVPIEFDPDKDWSQMRRLLTDMRQTIVELRSRQAPPPPPTNLKVTGMALGNLVQFTRSADADYYEVLWSATPSLSIQPNVINIGDTPAWFDATGPSVTRFYWVRARKYTGAKSPETGPVKGTSGVSTSTTVPPAPPPSGQVIVIEPGTGRQTYYELTRPLLEK